MNLIKVKTAIVQALPGLSTDDKWINRAIIFLEVALKIVVTTMREAFFS